MFQENKSFNDISILQVHADKLRLVINTKLVEQMISRGETRVEMPYKEITFSVQENQYTIGIYTPRHLIDEKSIPTLLHIPASAFICFQPYFAEVTCSQLAKQSGCKVIVITHRVAPEYQYPRALVDCYNVVKYIAQNTKALNIDPSRIAISGYCSGATCAAELSYLNTICALKISHQFLISPLLDLSRGVQTFREEELKDESVSSEFLHTIISCYVSDKNDLTNPLISPFWQHDHRELPPTDIILGTHDAVRGDGEEYATKLINAKNNVKIHRVDGNHGAFWFDIRVIETVAMRLRAVFGMLPVHRMVSHESSTAIVKYCDFFLKYQHTHKANHQQKNKTPVTEASNIMNRGL